MSDTTPEPTPLLRVSTMAAVKRHTDERLRELEAENAHLREENARLQAVARRYRGDLHRKLGNLIGPEIFPHRKLLCSSCSGKGTGLICSDCDTFNNEEMGRLVLERSRLRSEIEPLRELLETVKRCFPSVGKDPISVVEEAATRLATLKRKTHNNLCTVCDRDLNDGLPEVWEGEEDE